MAEKQLSPKSNQRMAAETQKSLSVRSSALFIAENAKNVRVNHEKIEVAAELILEQIKKKRYSTKAWKEHALNPKECTKETIEWIFLVDLLNFSFWNERSELLEYSVNGYKGYWSLCAAINRAIYDEGIPVTSPYWMKECSWEMIQHVFRPDAGCCQAPLLKERFQVIRKAASILVEDHGGSFVNIIKSANHSALKLVELIVQVFGDLFDDGVHYMGRRVSFNKRAQILVADIWACFEGQGWGLFDDIDEITMFADYRVPQTLLHFGLLEYSPELLQVLQCHLDHHSSETSDPLMNSKFMLQRGEEYEVEIRGCSIHVVELLIAAIKKHEYHVNAIIIDFLLWDLAKESKDIMSHLPIHLVRSIYY